MISHDRFRQQMLAKHKQQQQPVQPAQTAKAAPQPQEERPNLQRVLTSNPNRKAAVIAQCQEPGQGEMPFRVIWQAACDLTEYGQGHLVFCKLRHKGTTVWAYSTGAKLTAELPPTILQTILLEEHLNAKQP